MQFGVDYYPEHWPREEWETQAALMEQAGFTVVRVAEFAWHLIEPREGEFEFGWLDEAIETLARHGIRVVLGTPTAAPPKWLFDKYRIASVDAYGHERGFGSRRHYCYNNAEFRRLSARVAAKMAEHYRNCASVEAWQIDNEFGCHGDVFCYCENCRQAFIRWLIDKYGTIDALNKAWGTVFWSGTYDCFEDVILPAYTQCEFENRRQFCHNPSLLLDYRRFRTDTVIGYQQLQIDAIRAAGDDRPITHNFMGAYPDLDYFKLAKPLDFVSWDNYVVNQWAKSGCRETAMAHAITRSVKHAPFWVMEEQSGSAGWSDIGNTPRPGQLRLWTWAAAAHGARAVVYFRFRTCLFGAEQYWQGLLPADGVPGRRYREVSGTVSELSSLSPLLEGLKPECPAAILRSYESLWSQAEQRSHPKLDYNGWQQRTYAALSEQGVNAEFVSPDDDFSSYSLLAVPMTRIVSPELAEKLTRYAENGGTLLLSFQTGTRTTDNHFTDKTAPGLLRALAGVSVEEFDSVLYGEASGITGDFGGGKAQAWCEVLAPDDDTRVIAKYTDEYYAGRAAVTLHPFGKGKVIYLGCDLAPDALSRLFAFALGEAGVPVFPLPDGVERVRWSGNGRAVEFWLNHNAEPACLPLHGARRDALTGEALGEDIELSAFGAAALLDENVTGV